MSSFPASVAAGILRVPSVQPSPNFNVFNFPRVPLRGLEGRTHHKIPERLSQTVGVGSVAIDAGGQDSGESKPFYHRVGRPPP